MIKKEGISKRLENIKDKNDELLNTFATNKSSKNKKNTKGEVLTYNTKHSFVKLKNIDDMKKLPLDSMFNLMKEHHKKFNSLNNLKPRTIDNKNKRLKVLIHTGYIYDELYYIYKNKYKREIDRLNVENKGKLDYKQLKLDDHQYSSEEEQEKQEKQEKQEEQDKQDKKNHLIQKKLLNG